ncbi:MAG: VWA domain-containing protein [Gemmatimonadota bacterium]
MDRALERLMVKLATRRSRRLRPARRRGKVDLRRSLRDALRHDGELLRLARRDRRIDRPRLVLLCDVSGSMERYSRFLLRFILTACREPDVETFVFSTRLTRLGPWLPRADADRVLARLGARIQDWSGGTRIGASLSAFLDEYGRRMLGQRTVVIVLSDGLDQGEVEPLERAMRGIHRKARKVIWLNPLLESPDYRPEARGMKAALPYVDEFASGHSLEALRELTALVRL